MPVVNFKFAAVDSTLTSGTITLWSPKLRPGGSFAITKEPREAQLVDGVASIALEPGPVAGHIVGDGATHQLQFAVPSQDDPVDFLDLLNGDFVWEPEIVQAAQQAAREARKAAEEAVASAAVVGSAENVLASEAAAVAAREGAEAARDAAGVSATVAGQGADRAAAAADGAESALVTAEAARDRAVVAEGEAAGSSASAAASLSGAVSAQSAAEGAADGAASSASSADSDADRAEAARIGAEASAAAAARSEGVAATAAEDAAGAVRDELSDLANAAAGRAADAEAAAEAAAQSAMDAESVVADGVPDASSSIKGKLKLAGDLGGTAELPTVPGLADKVGTSDFNSALSEKLSKTNAGSRLYGTSSDGEQALVEYSTSSGAGTLAYRKPNGAVEVGAPLSNADATTKAYVDEAIDNAVGDVDFTEIEQQLLQKADIGYVDGRTPQIMIVAKLPSQPISGVVYMVTGSTPL